MKRGFTLIELMVALVALPLIMSLVVVTFLAARQSYDRCQTALSDIERAGRLMDDLKRDLRDAVAVRLRSPQEEKSMTIVRSDGTQVSYTASERVSSDGIRSYGDSVESVTIEDGGRGLRIITVTLRRRSTDGPPPPVWSTAVHCRNLR